MKNLKSLVIISSALGLVGCSPGASEHRKLCKKDAGTVVYKKVEANGFYSRSCSQNCWGTLLDTYERTGLNFIEFHINNPHSFDYISEAGYWRYFITNKDNPLCNEKIDERLNGYMNPDNFTKTFREHYCVAAKKLDSPTAKYIYERNDSVLAVGGLFGTEISKIELVIKERNGNEVLGRTIEYMLDTVPGTPHEGGRKSCTEYAYSTTPYLYEKVLTPFREE